MKIRHYNLANLGLRRTADVTPKSRNRFKLYLCKVGEDITGGDMKAYLKAVKFNEMFPTWDPPPMYIEHRNPFYREKNPEFDAYIQAYQQQWNTLLAWMDQNLSTYELIQEAKLPHEEGTVWELVDETKPYHDGRFTEIPVDPGKYNGGTEWVISERDEIMTFAEVCRYKRNPAHWLSYNSLYLK